MQAARGAAWPVLRASPGRLCHRPHERRPLERCSCVDPIEKKPLNHFLPAPPCCRSGRPAATWHAASARTGTSPNRGRSTRSQTLLRPGGSPPRPSRLDAAAPLSPTTTRSSSWSNDRCRRRLQEGRRSHGRRDRLIHGRGGEGRVLPPHGRRQRRPQGVHGGLLPPDLLGAPAAGARDARVPEARDVGVVRDHQPAHPGRQRLRRGDRCHVGDGWSSAWDPMYRCASRPSTPTGGCRTGRRRRRPPSPAPGASRLPTTSGTRTQATSPPTLSAQANGGENHSGGAR